MQGKGREKRLLSFGEYQAEQLDWIHLETRDVSGEIPNKSDAAVP